MSAAELHQRSIAEHAAGLRAGEYSCVELARHFLARVNNEFIRTKLYVGLNAFITVTEERALEQAAAADARIRAGEDGALIGIPLVHKDLFCTRGVKTTCGSKMLANFISPYDATVVARLAEAGAVMLAKTNMDEFAMGSSNETSHFGAARNPWRHTAVPGGSSGGSAAAVAARLACVATGTDTGGSIRQPAAFCGITGVKPSYGRVSRYGMVAFASSLDQGGVLTRSAADAAVLLRAMAGVDPADATSVDAPVPDYPALLAAPIAGKTIGVPREFFGAEVAPAVGEAVEAALALLRELGANTVPLSLPASAAAIACYYVIAPAEASSNLARYDGVRYGHRTTAADDLTELYERSRAEGFGAEVKRRIMVGTYVLSAGYYDAYYAKAQRLRRVIADEFNRAFEQCDLIAGPTTPTTAFEIGAVSDPVAMYRNDIFTNAVNLAGLPAASLPAGFDPAGLPIGLQLIARHLDETSLLQVAHHYQRATDWHTQTPPEAAR